MLYLDKNKQGGLWLLSTIVNLFFSSFSMNWNFSITLANVELSGN